MKKILSTKRLFVSVAMLLFVGAIVATTTGAFFSDTETSTGNTFTAGAIDLKIDAVTHYNGMICVAGGDDAVWYPASAVTLDDNNQPVGTPDFNHSAWNASNLAQYPQSGTVCTGTWALKDLGQTPDGESVATIH